MLTVGDVTGVLFRWAPAGLAWAKDNVGMIVGSANAQVRGIFVCLDVTERAVHEALTAGANLIVSHHPVIYQAIKSIRGESPQGRILSLLLKHDIAAVAMHTNADSSVFGLNDALAGALGLEQTTPLEPLADIHRRLLVEFDPTSAARHDVPSLMLERFGYRLRIRSEAGDSGVLELPSWDVDRVLEAFRSECGSAVKSCAVLPVSLDEARPGSGAIGTLPQPMPARAFLSMVKERLRCASLRTTPWEESTVIRRVAVCGGAGAFLAERAIARNADAFVTADVTYHTFLDVQSLLLLVDAGHYETELVFIPRCLEILRAALGEQSEKINILSIGCDTNPVRFH